MNTFNITLGAFALCTSIYCTLSHANESPDSLIGELSSEWADITYHKPRSQQLQLLADLASQADNGLAAYPEHADLITWAGIITASHAGAKRGLGALRSAKKAKKYFQQAIEINPHALDGGAKTSLGVLYYQVPSWPIGFGNTTKAEQLLESAAREHPDNINALYFLGDFLITEKRYREAHTILTSAESLPLRQDARVADEGRQLQIRSKLDWLNKRLS